MDKNEIQNQFDWVKNKLALASEQYDAVAKAEREQLEEGLKFLGQPRKPDMTEEEASIFIRKALYLKSKADEACQRADLVRAEIEALSKEAARLAGLLDKDGKK